MHPLCQVTNHLYIFMLPFISYGKCWTQINFLSYLLLLGGNQPSMNYTLHTDLHFWGFILFLSEIKLIFPQVTTVWPRLAWLLVHSPLSNCWPVGSVRSLPRRLLMAWALTAGFTTCLIPVIAFHWPTAAPSFPTKLPATIPSKYMLCHRLCNFIYFRSSFSLEVPD